MKNWRKKKEKDKERKKERREDGGKWENGKMGKWEGFVLRTTSVSPLDRDKDTLSLTREKCWRIFPYESE